MALFAADELSAESARRIEDALSGHGLSVEPSLLRVDRRDEVDVSIASRARRRLAEDATEPTYSPPPSATSPAEAIAVPSRRSSERGPNRRRARSWADRDGFGFAAWWGFGLLFLALTGAAWWSVGRMRFGLARVFLFPFRSLRLAAFTVGLVPMLLAVVLLSAIVVAPVSAKRASDARERDGRALVAQAARAVDRGDLNRAERLLDAAKDKDQDPGATTMSVAASDKRAASHRRARARAGVRRGARRLQPRRLCHCGCGAP